MGLGPTHLDGPVVLLLAHLDALQQLHVAVPHVAPWGHKHPETSVHLPRHRRLEPVIRLLSVIRLSGYPDCVIHLEAGEVVRDLAQADHHALLHTGTQLEAVLVPEMRNVKIALSHESG